MRCPYCKSTLKFVGEDIEIKLFKKKPKEGEDKKEEKPKEDKIKRICQFKHNETSSCGNDAVVDSDYCKIHKA